METEIKYQELCNTPSDINYHLPKLREYAEKCNHVTEMGMRTCVSTYAFLAAKPEKIVSYDINYDKEVENVKRLALGDGVEFVFIQKSVLEVEIEPTDMLFIDTWHVTAQLESELRMHSGKVKSYIAMHDTTTFAEFGEDNAPGNGLKYALDAFLENNKQWVVEYVSTENNGLTILKRC